ncbi:MAG: ABC transporter permease, partial [Acidimicrobiia bacterium]
MIRPALSVLRSAAVSALADLGTIYTWQTWTFSWLTRVLAQVTFFALIGRLLGSEDRVHFLLVGNAVAIAAIASLPVVASTTWERRSGTLPLLVACPSSPL